MDDPPAPDRAGEHVGLRNKAHLAGRAENSAARSMEISEYSLPVGDSFATAGEVEPSFSTTVSSLAELAARLEEQLEKIFRDALRDHARAVEQQLQALRRELAPNTRGGGGSFQRQRPAHLAPARCSGIKGPYSDSVVVQATAQRIADECYDSVFGNPGRDAVEAGSEAEPDVDMRQSFNHGPGPNPPGPRSEARFQRRSNTIHLKALEDSLAFSLFAAQDLVPAHQGRGKTGCTSSCPANFSISAERRQDSAEDAPPPDDTSDASFTAGGRSFRWCEDAESSPAAPGNRTCSRASTHETAGSADLLGFVPTPSLNVHSGDLCYGVADASEGSRSRRRSATCKAEALRQTREAELTNMYRRKSPLGSRTTAVRSISSLSGSEHQIPLRAPFVFLRACGSLPLVSTDDSMDSKPTFRPSALYQWAVVLVALAALASYVEQAAAAASSYRFADMSLGLGSVLGLLSLGVLRRGEIYSDCNALLLSYIRREGQLEVWVSRSCHELAVVGLIWIIAVLMRVAITMWHIVGDDGSVGLGVHTARSALFFALTSMQLMGLVFSVAHVCCGLTCMIDSFCCDVVEHEDLEAAARQWNILQAVLRKACCALEKCLFILQATFVLMILVSIAHVLVAGSQGFSLVDLLPAAAVMLGTARIPFNAAAVTAKCARVPAFVNSLSFGKDFDHERQYLVEYITHSHAGFYVFEMRLTASMALKFLYVIGACAFAVITKVASEVQ